jgi:hypothetical protein
MTGAIGKVSGNSGGAERVATDFCRTDEGQGPFAIESVFNNKQREEGDELSYLLKLGMGTILE